MVDCLALAENKGALLLHGSIGRAVKYLQMTGYLGDHMNRLALAWGIIVASCIIMTAAAMNPTISATGEGTVSVPADIATIIVSVSSGTGNTSQDRAAVQEMMDKAVGALKAAGVKDDDITLDESASLSSASSRSEICQTINNKTICNNSSLQATALGRSAMVNLKSTQKARIDELLDAAESAGAEAYVAGYGLSNSTAAMSQARAKAVANAHANAEEMAAAEGLRLGQVLEISDYSYPEDLYSGFFESSPTGMVDVTSYVAVTYELDL